MRSFVTKMAGATFYAENLGEHCLNIYQEIRNNCPFPGWKEGLKNL